MIGFLHALEIDHMLAVTAFVSRRPSVPLAARFGARWGIGHAMAVLAAGGALLLLGVRWPERWDAFGEALVGAMLIGLGAWALRSVRRMHLHSEREHGHAHLHVHAASAGHAHAHAPGEAGHDHSHGGITAVGFLHGLAGTSAVVALVPVTLMADMRAGLGYLAAFGIGVTLAMTLFAMAAAHLMQRAHARSVVLGRRAASLVGVAGILTGSFWLLRSLG
jgi:ABC-type nickel/cobalt efflux system permease component RcnA